MTTLSFRQFLLRSKRLFISIASVCKLILRYSGNMIRRQILFLHACLKEGVKKKLYLNGWIGKLLLLVSTQYFVVSCFIRAHDHAVMRYLNVCLALSLIGGSLIMAIQIYNRFCVEELKSDLDCRKLINRQKLWAEFFSAIAIIAFIGMYFRFGYEDDKNNVAVRFENLQKVRLITSKVMPPSYCISKYYRQTTCLVIQNALTKAGDGLLYRSESDVQDNIQTALFNMDMLNKAGENFSDQDWDSLKQAEKLLSDIRMDESWINFNFSQLQFLLMLFAAFSVSRKLSIAAFDATSKPHQIISWKSILDFIKKRRTV
ncbi:hypothetical protein [Undibacterium sp. Ji49W]|uniref:hypothetical protein n=1 Tax=Undibacterium sp. Ji49W TaxID=3413040 RepID=UPI003BF3866E